MKGLQGATNQLVMESAALASENAALKDRSVSTNISETERANIIAEARKEIIATIPTDDINKCLEDLVGKDKAKSQVRDWLETLQETQP